MVSKTPFPNGAINIDSKDGHVFMRAEKISNSADRWQRAVSDKSELPIVVIRDGKANIPVLSDLSAIEPQCMAGECFELIQCG